MSQTLLKPCRTSRILPWIVCFSASLFFCYELVQLHMLNALSPMLMRELGLNATQFGYLCSTYLLADVIFLLPAGIILDYFSTRKTILTALFLCILGTFGFAMSTSLSFAAFSHFLSGIGNAFCFLSCMMLVSRWFPADRRAFIMGLMVTVGLLGGVIAQTPFSLLAQKFNWRQALVIDGLIGMGIYCLIFLFVQDAPRKDSEGDIEKVTLSTFISRIKQAVVNRQNLLCGVYTGVFNLPVMVIGAVYGSLFLTQVHGLSLARASFVVSLICLGTITGSPIVGWLSDRMGKRRPVMFFGAVCSMVVMLAIIYAPVQSEASLMSLFFMLGLCTSAQVVGYPTISESNPPHLTGTGMGIAAVIIMGMGAIAQPLTGKLIDWHWSGAMMDSVRLYSSQNFTEALLIFPVTFLIGMVALLFIKEPREFATELAGEA
ncbi:MAG: putative MFS-type transporter YcaD [Chlamydiia bacterium]|nr:putative MFS-type transporter YcaD [Chlamydiia bacterium]